MRFVLVPPGRFVMGSPEDEDSRDDDESPTHEVVLSRPFYLQVTEVSNAEYRKFVPDHDSGTTVGGAPLNGDVQPAVGVNWEDAAAFAGWSTAHDYKFSYRLPTEAEWEYACRAGTSTPFWWGPRISPVQANYDARTPSNYDTDDRGRLDPALLYRGRTVSVWESPANPWGFLHVHGNVSEWCSDWYGDYGPGAAMDPSGPSAGWSRVLRGGNWDTRAYYLRSASRKPLAPTEERAYVGFRLAADLCEAALVESSPGQALRE